MKEKHPSQIYIENPEFTLMGMWFKKIEQYIQEGYNVSADYKSYDKQKNDRIIFVCFDVSSNVIAKNGILMETIKYDGNLTFYYDKRTKSVAIDRLPCISINNNAVHLLTHDIASIIVNQLKPYVNIDEVSISFPSNFKIFAIDEKTSEVIPTIKQTKNYVLIEAIIKQIGLEQTKIRQEVIRYKEHQDARYQKIERAISKKRKIMGLDPQDFNDIEDLYRTINEKIVNFYTNKLLNCQRHLEANSLKYKNLLSEAIGTDEEHLLRMAQEEGIKPTIESVVDYWFEKDLHDRKGAFAIVNNSHEYVNMQEFCGIPEKLYYVIANELFYKFRGRHLGYSFHPARKKEWYNFKGEQLEYGFEHPLWSFSAENSYERNKYYYSHEFKQTIDLILQMTELQRKISIYSQIISSPEKALLNFKKEDLWGNIMSIPYWIRKGRDIHQGCKHETFDLFMIKPGTTSFNIEDIKYFAADNGREFANKQDRKNFHVLDIIEKKVDRIVVTVPKSLEVKYIHKLIDYAHKSAKNINFVCENGDIATFVKKVLVLSDLDMIKKCNERYIKGRYFISIDPNYYDNFFINTPTNKNFWHLYDYSSSYKFRRKTYKDLGTVIEEYLSRHVSDILNDNYSFDALLEEIIGYYDRPDFYSTENEYECMAQEMKENPEDIEDDYYQTSDDFNLSTLTKRFPRYIE